MRVSRRSFLQGTAAALVLPRVQVADDTQLFRHGVASGDPLADRVMLWTRVTGPATRSAIGPITVAWQVASDEGLTQIVARGTAPATPDRDFTVKVDATGLDAGRTYFYAFEAGGQRSAIGRTRTLVPRGTARVRLGVVSCSNYGTGFFNVYRCLANREDLDAVLHLGDYIYETTTGDFGNGSKPGRVAQPVTPSVSLAEYRNRYAVYRTDADLQAAHSRHPFIVVWDDHEIANNAWAGGAEAHTALDGEWAARRTAAYRAYLEWMPVRESSQAGIRLYRAFRFGSMADVLMLDTRGMRDRQLAPQDVSRMDRRDRSLLGAPQERWMFDRLRASKRDGTRWRLLGQQIMFSSVSQPGSAPVADFWEGYPSARTRAIDFLADERMTNVAILAGDIHSSWALDVPAHPWSRERVNNRSLAVEIVTPAISSVPLFGETGMRKRVADQTSGAPHLRFLDGDRNGYVLLDVTRDRLQSDWYFVDAAERTDRESVGASFVCENGSARLTPP